MHAPAVTIPSKHDIDLLLPSPWLLPHAVFAAFGMMIVSLMPVPELAGVISAMFYSIWFVWGGFFIAYPQMVRGHIWICVI